MVGTGSDGPGGSESSFGDTTGSDCAEVYVGDLVFSGSGPHDVSGLDRVGRVEGSVAITGTDFSDLSFLGCLREVTGAVQIRDNGKLESLAGLEMLERAKEIRITVNVNLQSLDAVGPVASLEKLRIHGNLSLSDLGFDTLETVDSLHIGFCDLQASSIPPDDGLTDLSGFASLSSIADLVVARQEQLVSLGRLHDIAAAGGLSQAAFLDNPGLQYSEIEQLEAEADLDFSACGNLDDPMSSCSAATDPIPSECLAP